MFWITRDGRTLSAAVPGEPRAVALNARCCHCDAARVSVVDWRAGTYQCTAGHSHDIPERYSNVSARDHSAIMVYDYDRATKRRTLVMRVEGALVT